MSLTASEATGCAAELASSSPVHSCCFCCSQESEPHLPKILRPSEGVLSQRSIKFQERDIAQDPGALADLKKLGYMTTPVIVIDGAVIVGFDSAKIDEYAS